MQEVTLSLVVVAPNTKVSIHQPNVLEGGFLNGNVQCYARPRPREGFRDALQLDGCLPWLRHEPLVSKRPRMGQAVADTGDWGLENF